MKTAMISKALEEVWLWKKKCYEESKGIGVKEYLKLVHNNAEAALKNGGFVVKAGRLKKEK